MSNTFALPAKIPTHLRRIAIDYASASSNDVLLKIVTTATFTVKEGITYDNWEGGVNGHALSLYLPPSVLEQVPLSKQSEYQERIQADLNQCARSTAGEFIAEVHLELNDDSNPDFLRSKSAQVALASHDPDVAIWGVPGGIRTFISHRDHYKSEANRLSAALAEYGIACFVAHDTIEPMDLWQNTIKLGLATMEVMVALITPGFHESFWTNQEVGYALAKGVPIVPVKLPDDPQGFISDRQALRGSLDDIAASAPELYRILCDKIGHRGRLQGALVAAFASSSSYDEAIQRFDRLAAAVENLSETEEQAICQAFATNSQLNTCIYLCNERHRLIAFMREKTRHHYTISGTSLSYIPF